MRVRRTLVYRVDASPGLVDLDFPRVVEACTEVARLYVLGDLEPVRAGVLGVQGRMTHDQERPARCDGVKEHADRFVAQRVLQGLTMDARRTITRVPERGSP